MADARDTQPSHARVDRSDAALIADYIHELSERHGSEPNQAARSAGAGTESEDSGEL
jgi:hypothetical protein